MAMTLTDFQARLDVLLHDAAANLQVGDKDAAIVQAGVLYSNDRPLERVADIAGTGSFDLTLPTGWEDGFSRIKVIEYPYNATDSEPPQLADDEWVIYQAPIGKVLRFLAYVPAVGETVRVRFTAPHEIRLGTAVIIADSPDGAARASGIVTLTTLTPHGAASGDAVEIAGVIEPSFDGSFVVASVPTKMKVCYPQAGDDDASGAGTLALQSTIPESDFEAVCNLAASLAFLQLAALKVQSGDPTIAADAVEYRSKSDQYRAMAKEQRALYNQHLGKGGDVGPGSGIADMNVNLSVGLDRLTHPRRTQ